MKTTKMAVEAKNILLRNDGLYIREPGGGKRRLCPPIRVKAVAKVDGTSRHLAIISYQDREGNYHKEIVPMSLMQKRHLLKDKLLDGGFPLPSGDDGDAVLEHLQDTTEVRCITIVLKTGWISRGAYAFPDEVVGPDRKNYLYQSPYGGTPERGSGTRGSLEKWKSSVAVPAEKSAIAIFAIAIAFASMLLRWHKIESGGFHYYAPNSHGKTTIIMAALSVLYPVAVNGLVHWDATTAGLEQEALRCNDALLVLDEMGHLAGEDEKLAATQAAKISYRLAGGKGRLRSALYDPDGHACEWRLLFLSSGEMSIANLHAGVARKRYGGDELRLIDIPASLSEANGVFDNLGIGDDSAKLVDSIRTGATTHYGYAGREFLANYMTSFEDADQNVTRWMAKFYAHVGVEPSGSSGRFASRFALAYAAARLARSYGIVTWSKERILEAIGLCHAGAVRTVPDRAALMEASLNSVRRKLGKATRALDMRNGQKYGADELADAAAYLRRDSEEGDFYAVKPEALEKWLEPGVTLHTFGQEMIARNAVLTQARGLPTKQVKIKGLEKKVSYYCLRKSFVVEG
ncbi:DUF927 domain-containing protein [Ferrovibrio sp.]|uniref:DUF927 domain-containing protein n=1 Tax=Ferrovibrio sp. TaxID=1917215 RepID=UPI003D0E1552